MHFRPTTALTPDAVAAIVGQVLRWLARTGLIEPDDLYECSPARTDRLSGQRSVVVAHRRRLAVRKWPTPAHQRSTSGSQLCDGFRSQLQVTPGDSTRPIADLDPATVRARNCRMPVAGNRALDSSRVPRSGHSRLYIHSEPNAWNSRWPSTARVTAHDPDLLLIISHDKDAKSTEPARADRGEADS